MSAMFLLLSRPRDAILGASTPAVLEGDVMLGTGVTRSFWTVGVAVVGRAWQTWAGPDMSPTMFTFISASLPFFTCTETSPGAAQGFPPFNIVPLR